MKSTNKYKSHQSGFALVEGILIAAIIAILAGTGYYVFHSNPINNKPVVVQKPNKAPIAMTFEKCIEKANKDNYGATLDENMKILTCHHGANKYTQTAMAKVETVTSTFSRPSFGELPVSIKQKVLDTSLAADCAGKKVTLDSQDDSAVSAMMSGKFIEIGVGCDGANIYTFQLSNNTWNEINIKKIKDFCEFVSENDYPIELLKNTFDSRITEAAKCTDSQLIEHEVVTL